jgi:argininosuccinate lyase
VKGRSARAAGAFVAAATAMHATPFANSVAVGTEGCAGAVEALDAAADSVTLLRLVVAGARPQPAAMLARAAAGHTTATAWAERLVTEEGLSFREAHHIVGRLLTDADESDRRSPAAPVTGHDRPELADGLDPTSVARAARFGAGPGAPPALDDLRRRRAGEALDLADRTGRWRRADTDLAAAVAAVIGSQPPEGRAPVLAEAGRTA